MSFLKMEDFEVKDAELQMEQDSDVEIKDIGFDVINNDNETEFLQHNNSPNESDIEQDSDNENLLNFNKKKSRNPAYIISTLEKISHYRDKYLETIENQRNKNPENTEVIEFDKWTKYIKDKDIIIHPKKKEN